MMILDLCAGLGGASQAMKERGWGVVTVDIDPSFNTDIVADITTWSWQGERPDLIWASPPCNEFAREFMPWCKTGKMPGMKLINACKRIIEECNPRYWVIENVRGAVPYLGKPRAIVGPFFLWGFFPPLPDFVLDYRKKESMSSSRSWKAERAKIPYRLSLEMALTIERQSVLLEAQP